MKLFRFALNIWITVASLLSFLLGWVFLAHSPKPAQNTTIAVTSPAALPTLTPLQDLQIGGDSGSNFPSLQVPNSDFSAPAARPLFRTGGS